MSYVYKEKIKEDLEYSLEGVSTDYYSSEELIHKQKVKELDNVYAQAAKADEYEAKAESYTELVSQISVVDEIVASNYDKDMTDTNLHLLMLGAEVKRFFESGEYDAKK